MKELIESALAGGLKDLAGLELSGTIPVKQELINEALQLALESPPPPTSPKFDGKALLPYVKKAKIDANNGKLTLTFEIKIPAPDR